MRSPPMPAYYQVELQAGENETITLYEIAVDESLYSGGICCRSHADRK